MLWSCDSSWVVQDGGLQQAGPGKETMLDILSSQCICFDIFWVSKRETFAFIECPHNALNSETNIDWIRLKIALFIFDNWCFGTKGTLPNLPCANPGLIHVLNTFKPIVQPAWFDDQCFSLHFTHDQFSPFFFFFFACDSQSSSPRGGYSLCEGDG